MSSAIQQLAAKINRLERNMQAMSTTPQLAHSSIEDGGSVDSNADDGTTMAQFGGQFDGSYMAASLVGPTPPTPSVPIVTPVIGGLAVRWDGLFADAEFAPMDFARVEVHVSTDSDFVPDLALTLVATIESPRGAEPLIALGVGTYYVAFVARSLSGGAGPGSVQTSGEVIAIQGSQLAADAIDGKTITGAIIRTAETGTRWIIGDPDQPQFDNVILGYTDAAEENAPGIIQIVDELYRMLLYLASPSVVGHDPATLELVALKDGTEVIASLTADRIGLAAPEVVCGGTINATNTPFRRRGSVVNATTTAQGLIVVTHNLGVVPAIILHSVNGAATTNERTLRTVSRTTTTFTVAAYYNGLQVMSNAGWDFDWIVEQ